MKKITNLIIVDASGSMESKIAEVKGGLRQLIKSIKKDEFDSSTIIVDFSGTGDVNVLVNTSDRNFLAESMADSYKTRGWTALYDAVGYAFSLVPENQDGVFVSIMTDGQENNSKEFKAADIKALIEAKRKENWVVTFMGTDEKCLENAQAMGISIGNTMTYVNTGAGTLTATSTLDEARSYYGNAIATGLTINTASLLEDTVEENKKTA